MMPSNLLPFMAALCPALLLCMVAPGAVVVGSGKDCSGDYEEPAYRAYMESEGSPVEQISQDRLALRNFL